MSDYAYCRIIGWLEDTELEGHRNSWQWNIIIINKFLDIVHCPTFTKTKFRILEYPSVVRYSLLCRAQSIELVPIPGDIIQFPKWRLNKNLDDNNKKSNQWIWKQHKGGSHDLMKVLWHKFLNEGLKKIRESSELHVLRPKYERSMSQIQAKTNSATSVCLLPAIYVSLCSVRLSADGSP
jgi:hypothetical protein